MKQMYARQMVVLTALSLFSSAAFAQTSVTTEAPATKPAPKTPAVHKAKPATVLKKTGGYDLGPEPTSPKSVPMDFSYMKKPDDGRAHHETDTPSSSSSSQGFAPSMGTSGNGGFSPGMSLGF